ncbi:hypothetical protein [Sphingobium yanoikuyae]|uniref:hypothetical protein n=1 Tax=Sphingobium yanoikuyae TaxID=13690 RepID=UPI0026F01A89|nr:hypothetical protein [Sphingobium yanoikuyae]
MPIFRKAVDRLADLMRCDRKATYRAIINARLAPYVTPLLDRIVADDEDGDTLRNSLIPWRRAQRPPVAIYRGDVSTCRIEGPWQVADRHWLPPGGLMVKTGVTAHLNPFEAQALHKRMQQAIEDTGLAWVRKRDLYALRHVPDEIDRKKADPAAKAMIAAWVSRQDEACADPHFGSGEADGCCSGGPAVPCVVLAGKDQIMSEPVAEMARLLGCDATHRADNSDTHLTHGCIQHFCGFDAMRIASRQTRGQGNGAIAPFSAMANSISAGAVR